MTDNWFKAEVSFSCPHWNVGFDSQFVDWIYAQPPDPHPDSWDRPRRLVVDVSGVAKKLVQDPRFLGADAQLLYYIEQSRVGSWNLTYSESDRLNKLILRIDLSNPKATPESDCIEIRKLLRKGASESDSGLRLNRTNPRP